MLIGLRLLRRIARELPRYGKLTYALYRDPRVPPRNKVLLAAALLAIYNPVVDLPLWVPVVGELDALALTVLAIKVFVDRAPKAVVAEHQAAIQAGDSVFDHDLHDAGDTARTRLHQWWAQRRMH